MNIEYNKDSHTILIIPDNLDEKRGFVEFLLQMPYGGDDLIRGQVGLSIHGNLEINLRRYEGC